MCYTVEDTTTKGGTVTRDERQRKAFSRIPMERRAHRCYELAGRYLLEYDPSAVLVHGEVHPVVDHAFVESTVDHAWIEYDAGRRVYDPVEDFDGPVSEYIALRAARPIMKYDAKEAAQQFCTSRFWGPWWRSDTVKSKGAL